MATKLGVLGDSNNDSYRADDNRGGAYAAVTLNAVELLVRMRGFDVGTWDTYSEPRRTDYAYNWARSAATSATLISGGQHTGLAAQCHAGLVDFVYMEIGANDFHPGQTTYTEVYDGSLSDNDLTTKVNQCIADVTTAVDAILAEPVTGMLITPFLQVLDEAELISMYPTRAGRLRVYNAVGLINTAIGDLTATRAKLKVSDVNAVNHKLTDWSVDGSTTIDAWGQEISMTQADEPHGARLNDSAGHWGTIICGLKANDLIIGPLNTHWNVGEKPLMPWELWGMVGVDAGVKGSMRRS